MRELFWLFFFSTIGKNEKRYTMTNSAVKQTSRVAKGTTVPALTISEIDSIAKTIADRNVKDGDRELLADILGNSPKSSTMDNKYTTLRSFGIITSSDSGGWMLTDLGERLVFAASAEDKQVALQKICISHPVIQKIWDFYKGRTIDEEYLSNAVMQNGGVSDTLKTEWATYFLEAMRYAGLTKQSGDKEIVSATIGSSDSKKTDEGKSTKPPNDLPPPPPVGNAETIERLSSTLTGGTRLQKKVGGSIVLIYLDDEISSDDAKQLSRFMEVGGLIIQSHGE
jgi:hypothetical protein